MVTISVEGRGATVQDAMTDLMHRLAGVTRVEAAPVAVVPEQEAPPRDAKPAGPRLAEKPKRTRNYTGPTKKEEAVSEQAIPVEDVRAAASEYGKIYGGKALKEKIRQQGVETEKFSDLPPAKYAAFLASLQPTQAASEEPEEAILEPVDESESTETGSTEEFSL